MNCMDFRRAYLTDPYRLEAEQQTHLRECEACTRFVNRQSAADQHLQVAMRIPVRKELSANVIFERSLRSRRGWRMLAMAATVVLTMAASLGVAMYWPAAAPDLGQQLAAHMQADPLQTMPDQADANAKLTQVAAQLHFGVDTAMLGARVVRVKLCDVKGHKGLHMVLQKADGTRSTVFVMPSTVNADMEWVQGQAQRGLMMPGRKGVVVVFCPESQDRSQLMALAERMQRAVTWNG